MTEQVRTNILSSGYLHINVEDHREIKSETDEHIRSQKFVHKVDQILRMHKGQFIDKLWITYPLDTFPISNRVDSWINIVGQKQVKALVLDFRAGQIMKEQDQDRAQIFSLGYTTFSSLVTLYLQGAYLCDHIIHGMLLNSPNLLELSIVQCSSVLKHLNISGSSLKLKHLVLVDSCIKCLEISAPNLVSFSFNNLSDTLWTERICFKNIPLLTKLTCSLGITLPSWHDFYALLPQIVTLTLTHRHNTLGDISIHPDFPLLINLKMMYVRLLSKDDIGRLLALLRASPSLYRLSLHLETFRWKHNKYSIKNFPDHKFLKEIEIYDFRGFDYVMQLLICIAQSCSSLQKIIIHPDAREYDKIVKQESGESVVKKLEAQSFASLQQIIIHPDSYKIDYQGKAEQEISVESAVKKLASRLPQKELKIVLEAPNAYY